MSPFWVDVSHDSDTVVVRPRGELNLATAERLQDVLAALVPSGATRVVVDLRELEVLDSSYLMLEVWAHELDQEGLKVAFVDGGEPTRQVLDITGVSRHLNFVSH